MPLVCALCGDVVAASERRDHLAGHSPAAESALETDDLQNHFQETDAFWRLDQLRALGQEEQAAIGAVIECLTGEQPATDEDLSSALNILRPHDDGCIPNEEIGDNLLFDIRRKFACLVNAAVDLAREALKAQGLVESQHHAFCVIIDPDFEDATHYCVVDYHRQGWCYLHEYAKAWHLEFPNLKEIAAEVLRLRSEILAQWATLTDMEIVRNSGKPVWVDAFAKGKTP